MPHTEGIHKLTPTDRSLPAPRPAVDSPLSIDGSQPLPVRRPASVAEVCELVRAAKAAGEGVYPVGGRTSLDVGLPPTKPGFALDATALDAVIDYPARDMTITVQAGVTVGKLRAALAAEGQWLPVDVPRADAATLGGAVALNQSGPRRLGYGTLRDYVIGVQFVADDGRVVNAGGRVVKNVAGYDLMKIHTGALGTLGVLTQLTLKVRPKPEAAVAVRLDCEGPHLAAVLDVLHASKSRPVACHVARATGSPWQVTVVFEEKAATVPWQKSTLLADLAAAPLTAAEVLTDADPNALIRKATDAAAGWRPDGPAARFVWKASVRRSRTAAFCVAASGLSDAMTVHAEGLSGIVHGTGDVDEPTAAAMLTQLTALAGDGSVVVRRCPPAWKAALPVWGRLPADVAVMRQVKHALDPADVFNPGRLFPTI
ncbi:FAD-binding oxidoreductase [Urbifossiella limnaea]|uniref:Putative FAD-linked oxidoreductase n=1 Tax=Urbifossiella limnaea TaxID=2528023 RepID=A0A517XRB4_9BACT|nr:FAD-binding oxidoreductase [Urbifossiella limnaea]QDU20051.1 putative FAD-linked oxidoreductase [Urbifossiella limnaea]